jgi:Uncharacterized protein conserved in bacteria
MSWYLDDFLARLREAHDFGNSTTSDLELLATLSPVFVFCASCDVTNCARHCPRLAHFRQDFGKCRKGKSILREPEFDPDLIEQSLHEAERQEKIWDDFFRRIGIKPFKVEYEKLCQDYERTIQRSAELSRIKLPAGARVGPPATTRQADEISRMWEERFLAERPSAYSPASG